MGSFGGTGNLQRFHLRSVPKPQLRGKCSDGIGKGGWGEVPIVLFCHTGRVSRLARLALVSLCLDQGRDSVPP